MTNGASARELDALTARIRCSLADWVGCGARLCAGPQLVPHRWSFFIRYKVARARGETLRLLVKVPRLEGMDTLAQAAQATTMNQATTSVNMHPAITSIFEAEYSFALIPFSTTDDCR